MSNLKRHELTHQKEEKEFKCVVYLKIFSRQDSHKRHLVEQHKIWEKDNIVERVSGFAKFVEHLVKNEVKQMMKR